MPIVDRDLREWLRSLGKPAPRVNGATVSEDRELSDDAAEHLARIASDGTLKAALAELSASDPDLSD